MELYFIPLTCTLACHILIREGDLPVKLRRMKMATKEIEGGGSLLDVNPMASVPVLRRDDGFILTEAPAVLQYLADMKPAVGLAPPAGTDERYQMARWLNFVGTEMHKWVFYNIFGKGSDDASKARARAAAPARFEVLSKTLQGRDYLLGSQFTAADAYLTWCLMIAPRAGIDVKPYPVLEAYLQRCTLRPGARAAIEYERALVAR